MVEPIQEWGPFHRPEKLLDGTDVDVLINKKRAHKMIIDEANEAERKTRLRL
jgi:hypothetical protein